MAILILSADEDLSDLTFMSEGIKEDFEAISISNIEVIVRSQGHEIDIIKGPFTNEY